MTSPNENYTSWTVGMRVVCVDAEWHDRHPLGLPCPLVLSTVYTVYTVAKVGPAGGVYRGSTGHISVFLREVRNQPPGYDEIGFAVHRFRPVQTRRTSIAIFQRMLSNPHKKIHEVEGERV